MDKHNETPNNIIDLSAERAKRAGRLAKTALVVPQNDTTHVTEVIYLPRERIAQKKSCSILDPLGYLNQNLHGVQKEEVEKLLGTIGDGTNHDTLLGVARDLAELVERRGSTVSLAEIYNTVYKPSSK